MNNKIKAKINGKIKEKMENKNYLELETKNKELKHSKNQSKNQVGSKVEKGIASFVFLVILAFALPYTTLAVLDSGLGMDLSQKVYAQANSQVGVQTSTQAINPVSSATSSLISSRPFNPSISSISSSLFSNSAGNSVDNSSQVFTQIEAQSSISSSNSSSSFRQDLAQARGLIVSPTINELDMQRGATANVDITLENDSQQDDYTITTVAETFEASGEEGVPTQRPFNQTEAHRTWVSFNPSKIELADGQKEVVKVAVTVPPNAQAGSYLYALVFEVNINDKNADATAGQAVVKTVTRISSLLFVNVQGEVARQVNFEKFEASTTSPNLPGVNGVFDPFFDIVNVDYRIESDGNFSYRPTGNILFFNGEGVDPVFAPSINPTNKVVLAGTARNFGLSTLPTFNWPVLTQLGNDAKTMENSYNVKRPWLGNQKIQASFTYKNSNDTVERRAVEKQVFFFPWKTLLLVLVCTFLVYGVYLWQKRNKQKINKNNHKNGYQQQSNQGGRRQNEEQNRFYID